MLYIILTVLLLSNIFAACVDYTIQSGDYSYKIINAICNLGRGCESGAVGQYPTLRNDAQEWCPSALFVGQRVQVCCTDSGSPNPSSCVDYTAQPGDYTFKIVNDVCSTTSGCAQGAANVYPTALNAQGQWCPNAIFIGQVLQVCCSEGGSPTPSPSSGGGDCPFVRIVRPSDTVFITIDDGPSFGGRNHLLDAIGQTGAKASFFDSGYQVCNDLSAPICQAWAYGTNVQSLVRTVKEGHFLGSHSDNHYYDAALGNCNYLGIPPQVRPASRLQTCGSAPLQNMVQGARQLERALRQGTWNNAAERRLRNRAIRNIWLYARMPCSDIWRTKDGIYEDNLPGVGSAEAALRSSIANDMFSGNVQCRPRRFNGVPWEIFGFNSEIEWFGNTILNNGETCRMVGLIERAMDNAVSHPSKAGKVVVLTHDFHFNSAAKANVMRKVIAELQNKNYKLSTIDQY